MIVLVETNSGVKKCFIRDKIFMEVDQDNKKIPNGTIRTSVIQNIIWITKGKMKKYPTTEWLKMADEKDYFNLE